MKVAIEIASAKELKEKIAAFKTLFDLRFVEPTVIEVATDYVVTKVGNKLVTLRGEGQEVRERPRGVYTIEAPVKTKGLFA